MTFFSKTVERRPVTITPPSLSSRILRLLRSLLHTAGKTEAHAFPGAPFGCWWNAVRSKGLDVDKTKCCPRSLSCDDGNNPKTDVAYKRLRVNKHISRRGIGALWVVRRFRWQMHWTSLSCDVNTHQTKHNFLFFENPKPDEYWNQSNLWINQMWFAVILLFTSEILAENYGLDSNRSFSEATCQDDARLSVSENRKDKDRQRSRTFSPPWKRSEGPMPVKTSRLSSMTWN
jgi:hypothetical protein